MLIIASFVGAAITSVFAIGGGIIILVLMSYLLPAAAVIPVHGAVMAGSNASRMLVYFTHIRWDIWVWFFGGAILGALAGAQFAVAVPAEILRLLIGCFILLSQWVSSRAIASVTQLFAGASHTASQSGSRSYFITGMISSFLTLFVGATGPFLTSILTNAQTARHALAGTAGACLTMQHSIKVLVFALAGFSFASYAKLTAACILATYLGTYLGSHLLPNLPEKTFRRYLKYTLTGVALNLIFWSVYHAL